MRFARKLMLLAITAIAAMAFAAAPASATDTVEVVNEKTATVCDPNCEVHASGKATLRVDLVFFESTEATCNLEVQMRVTKTGSGSIYDLEHTTGPDANCATVVAECKLPWAASGEEDGATGVVQSSAAVCLDPSESDSNCEGNLAFDIVELAGESYQTQFNNSTVGLCELDVDLTIESSVSTNAAIHVNHP